MDIDLVLALFAGAMLVFAAFSTVLQRLSLPGPLLCLGFGVLIGPHALGLLRMDDFGAPPGTVLEQAARITLAVGLAGVALRLPHGYWRSEARWIAVIIGLGTALMLVVATGVLWWWLGAPFLVALLLGAIITPTDPVVTTPVVTGSLAEERIPGRVRHHLSAESGINDGLAYLFVLLPVLLLTEPDRAWHQLLATVLLREVLGAAAFGALSGYLLGRLFVLVREHDLMEDSSYLAFVVPLALGVLRAARGPRCRAAAAPPRRPVGPPAAAAGRPRPLRDVLPELVRADRHLRAGLRRTGRAAHRQPRRLRPRHPHTTLAITLSVLIHGLSTAPLNAWLRHREPARNRQEEIVP